MTELLDAALMILLSCDYNVMSLGNYKNTVGKYQILLQKLGFDENLLKIHNSSKKYLNDHLQK